ncbi:MAG: hypothetical protein RIS21_458 [Planctomycetota bacterium]|jgi:NADH-quinone oxidoreductase subunit H
MTLGHALLKAGIGFLFVLQMLPLMIYLERKGSAFIQDRLGPNRAYIPGVGLRLAGVVHTLADVVKLLTKEDLVPKHVNAFHYKLAPALAMFCALAIGAVIPYAHPVSFPDGTVFRVQGIDLDVGILYMLAISSIGVYAVVLAGWASNNKYSQLGGLRASASMISYELSMGLGVIGLLLVYGSVDLNTMVAKQGDLAFGFLPKWGIVVQPIAFLLYCTAAFAETNRNPFDLAEGEAELVAGFHTEYGSFKFALFFMAEYVNIVVQSLVMATMFLGGWQIPGVSHEWLVKPENTALVLKGILGFLAVAGTFIGFRLLAWHKKNRMVWKDERGREGAILAVLLGFGPAITAAAVFLLWTSGLGPSSAAVWTAVIQFLVLVTKALLFCWLFIWVRWTTPRFRYDQLMNLGWRLLLPLGLINVFGTGLLVKAGIL